MKGTNMNKIISTGIAAAAIAAGIGLAPMAAATPAQGQGANAGQDGGTTNVAQRATDSAGGQGGGAPVSGAGGAGGGSWVDQFDQRNIREPFGALDRFIRVFFGNGRGL